MYEASVETSFTAAHSVRAPDGSMEQTHEHPWQVTAVFRARQLDGDGFVIDFLAARDALQRAAAPLSGSDLNEALGRTDVGASAERLAQYIAEMLAETLGRQPYCVRVVEAPGCAGAFYPDAGPT